MGKALNISQLARIPSAYSAIETLPLGSWSGKLNQKFASGALAVTGVLDILSLDYDGEILNSFFENYYNRVWVLPTSAVDFGEVGGLTQISKLIWNSYLTPTTISSISTGLINVGYSGVSLSQVLSPLEVQTVVFSTNENGPDVISGQYTFSFSQGGAKVLEFFGRRSFQWPTVDFSVNWAVPYEVEIEYRTDVFVSRNGKEQRRAQRRKPRKRITYQSIFERSSLRKFNAILAERQTRTFTVPEETKTARLAAIAPAGTDVLTFASRPSWVQPSFTYMLLLDNRRETVRVASVSGNTATLTSLLANTWYVDDYAVPMLTVRAATSISSPLVTNSVAVVTQEWEVEPTTEAFETPVISYPLYANYYVFNNTHNWAGSLETQKNYERQEVDFGKGRARYYTPIDLPTQIRTLSLVAQNTAELENIQNFFQEMRGRAGEFWLPTWERDLELLADAAPGTDRLLCEGTELASYYPGDKVFKNILIYFNDGTSSFHRIESYQQLGNNTEVQLTEVLPAGLLKQQVQLICFLPRARFASDTLTVTWLTREVATVNISFQTLEDL